MTASLKNARGISVYESRWGFHPCSREDCRRLKDLHRIAYDCMKQAMKHHRWIKKTVHQVGPEPQVSPQQEKMGRTDLEMKKFYQELLSDYQKARRPVKNQDEIESVSTPDMWSIDLMIK